MAEWLMDGTCAGIVNRALAAAVIATEAHMSGLVQTSDSFLPVLPIT